MELASLLFCLQRYYPHNILQLLFYNWNGWNDSPWNVKDIKPMAIEPQSPNFDEKLSAIIGLVLGLLFVAGGFWVRHIDLREQATFNEAQGTVVDTIARRERDNTNNQEKVTYAPVIEFLANGDRTRFTGKYESYRASNGNRVVVRYDPQKPVTTARVVDPLESWAAWAMFGIGGVSVFWSLGTLLPVRAWFSHLFD
jgi:hypothetical protein